MGAARAACARQGLDDDDRRAMQEAVTGKASMADMSIAELAKLLDHLNKDWKGPQGHRPHIGKIRALWWSLYWIGAIDDPNDWAIDGFVQRQTGIASLRFLDHRRAPSVIEALKSWLAREGVKWPAEADLADLNDRAGVMNIAKMERWAVLDVIQAQLKRRELIYAGWIEYCQRALTLKRSHWHWSERELDASIRLLGKKLRTAMAKQSAE